MLFLMVHLLRVKCRLSLIIYLEQGAAGSSTLNKLELTMKEGSRLFISPNVKAKISQLVTDNLFSGITGAPVISPSSSDDYIRNLLLKSELEIDRPVNLDSASETYNKLENIKFFYN